jgi:hypothetical protein
MDIGNIRRAALLGLAAAMGILIAVAICSATTVQVTLTGVNGVKVNLTGVNGVGNETVDVDPYYGTINGNPATLVCDDFDHETYIGESWTATVSTLSDLSSVRFQQGTPTETLGHGSIRAIEHYSAGAARLRARITELRHPAHFF